MDDNSELLQAEDPSTFSLVGRIRIGPSAWLQSDAEFERALEYEIQGVRQEVSELRRELLRRKKETNV